MAPQDSGRPRSLVNALVGQHRSAGRMFNSSSSALDPQSQARRNDAVVRAQFHLARQQKGVYNVQVLRAAGLFLTTRDIIEGKIDTTEKYSCFENVEQARAFKSAHAPIDPHRAMDPNIPTTNEQKRVIAVMLCEAIYTHRDIDPSQVSRSVTNFVNGAPDPLFVEASCWDMVEMAIDRAKRGSVMRCYGQDPMRPIEQEPTFTQIIDGLVYAFSQQKSLAKNVLDPPYYTKVIDDPLAMLNKSTSNVENNKGRGRGKSESKEQKKKSGTQDVDGDNEDEKDQHQDGADNEAQIKPIKRRKRTSGGAFIRSEIEAPSLRGRVSPATSSTTPNSAPGQASFQPSSIGGKSNAPSYHNDLPMHTSRIHKVNALQQAPQPLQYGVATQTALPQFPTYPNVFQPSSTIMRRPTATPWATAGRTTHANDNIFTSNDDDLLSTSAADMSFLQRSASLTGHVPAHGQLQANYAPAISPTMAVNPHSSFQQSSTGRPNTAVVGAVG